MYQSFLLLLYLPFFFVLLSWCSSFFFFFLFNAFVGVFVSADLDYFLASMIGLSGTQNMMVSINTILFYFLSKHVPAISVSLSSLLMEFTTPALTVPYIVPVTPHMAMWSK
jgi:hypothetical protein